MRKKTLTKVDAQVPPAGTHRSRENSPTPRREAAVRAAIEVLAQHGARGLTHRQVDRHLRWPLGSTSNYFRRRNDIFIAIAEHIVQLDIADLAFETYFKQSGSIGLELFVERIATLMQKWTRPAYRNRMLAGAEVLFESTRNAELRQATRFQVSMNLAWYRRIFTQLGSADPIASTNLFSLLMSGMYLTFCVSKELPSAPELRALVLGWAKISLERAEEEKLDSPKHSIRSSTSER